MDININNIKMSSSLPKIKTSIDNSQTRSQKSLKFKKLKLSTDQSVPDIRERFKSVRSERLTSLERYSTVQEQREYRNEKIHLNLLERKLLTGTYDETNEIGNDLNNLKHKTDYYRTQSVKLSQEIEKVKLQVEETKKEIAIHQSQKTEKDKAIDEAQRKHEKQKSKTDSTILERAVYEKMILDRKAINLFLTNKTNESRTYLSKLQSLNSHVQNQLREGIEKVKNLESVINKIHKQMAFDSKKRQQLIYQKQSMINKRKEDEHLRDARSKVYLQGLQQAEVELQQRQFLDSYTQVLANKFASSFAQTAINNLKGKYQKMQNMYYRICSFRKFNQEQPNEMVIRFQALQPETTEYSQKIKKLEEQAINLQIKYNRLQEKYAESLITTKKIPMEESKKQIANDHYEVEDLEKLEHEKKCRHLVEQRLKLEQMTDRIRHWSERYAKQLQVSIKKTTSWEGISRNIINITKGLLADTQRYEQNRKIQQQRAEAKNKNKAAENLQPVTHDQANDHTEQQGPQKTTPQP